MVKLVRFSWHQTGSRIEKATRIPGKRPKEWKLARVTPIFKDGCKCSVNNYRPISVLPVTLKVLERAVHDQLYSFLVSQGLLTQEQSGFRKLHSTTSALTHFLDQIQQDIDGGRCCGVLFLDLKKAFDTVDHPILLEKLVSYGVEGNEHLWFTSYLSNRKQKTCINCIFSDSKEVTCGVPQGSIIGPLLFILYINDLPDIITNCQISLYADDTALYFSAQNPDDIRTTLTNEMEVVSQWFRINKLTLNTKKTKVMVFGTPYRLKSFPPSIYRWTTTQLNRSLPSNTWESLWTAHSLLPNISNVFHVK